MNEHKADEGPKTKDERRAVRHSPREAVIRHAKRAFVLRHLIVFLVVIGLLLPPMSTRVTAQSTDDRVERILAAMSVEQRVGQLFMVDFLGAEAKPDSAIAHLIRDYHVGAVYLDVAEWQHHQRDRHTGASGAPDQLAPTTRLR